MSFENKNHGSIACFGSRPYLCYMQHQQNFYSSVQDIRKTGRKAIVSLIDPDVPSTELLEQSIRYSIEADVDFFFVGGSLILFDQLKTCVTRLKELTSKPIVLFPASTFQLCDSADAILYLSLVSGRNPDLLIGKQIEAAPYLKASTLEVVSTAYMLVDGGAPTTASYISNTQPIPRDKNNIAIATAMAAEYMGMKLLYMDAGSGAQKSISDEMIQSVRQHVNLPIILGGGIRSAEEAWQKAKAGADLIVVGNALESNPSLIKEMCTAIRSIKTRA